jgi:hypothetical protein
MYPFPVYSSFDAKIDLRARLFSEIHVYKSSKLWFSLMALFPYHK